MSSLNMVGYISSVSTSIITLATTPSSRVTSLQVILDHIVKICIWIMDIVLLFIETKNNLSVGFPVVSMIMHTKCCLGVTMFLTQLTKVNVLYMFCFNMIDTTILVSSLKSTISTNEDGAILNHFCMNAGFCFQFYKWQTKINLLFMICDVSWYVAIGHYWLDKSYDSNYNDMQFQHDWILHDFSNVLSV